MTGRASREKGKRGEREVSRILRTWFPEHSESIHRGWQARDGADAADVEGLPGLWVEVKRMAKCNLRAALKQAQADAPLSRIPIAVTRDDGGPWLATLELEQLCELIRYGRLAVKLRDEKDGEHEA